MECNVERIVHKATSTPRKTPIFTRDGLGTAKPAKDYAKPNCPPDPRCSCGHGHFDHRGTNGGACIDKACMCQAFTYPIAKALTVVAALVSVGLALGCTSAPMSCPPLETSESHVVISVEAHLPPVKAHWKAGKYWEWEPSSVKEQYVREADGAALVEVTYANPSKTETWLVCSGMTGDCYGEYVSRKDAEKKAASVAEEVNRKRPAGGGGPR